MKKVGKYLITTFLIVFLSCREKVVVLEPETIALTSYDQIVPITDSLVKPMIYQAIPSLKGLPVKESKSKFVAAVLPSILIAKYYLQQDREKAAGLINKKVWTAEDSSFYQDQAVRFKAKSIEGLVMRMNTHPNSIILAQAVVESGWGSSRFSQQANNLFGIWSYRSEEPRIAAKIARKDQRVYLRRYENITESITDYFETVGRSRAYRHFRKARSESENVDELLPHLKYYSERREEYVRQLKTIIAQNDFTKYDHYQLDPGYFVEKEKAPEQTNAYTAYATLAGVFFRMPGNHQNQ